MQENEERGGGPEENMEVKTMAKLIECGLKRLLTGKEGEGYGEEGGWKSIIIAGIVGEGFCKKGANHIHNHHTESSQSQFLKV